VSTNTQPSQHLLVAGLATFAGCLYYQHQPVLVYSYFGHSNIIGEIAGLAAIAGRRFLSHNCCQYMLLPTLAT
jgi:hypothetical protein